MSEKLRLLLKNTRWIKPLLPTGLALLILAAAGYTRPGLNWLRAGLGTNGLKTVIALIFGATAGGFLLYLKKIKPSPGRLLALSLVALAGIAYSFLIPAWPEERIHLLEYAGLGWLSFNLVRVEAQSLGEKLGVPLLFGILIGGCDEILQFYLPDRVGDLRDVLFNSLGTAWGVALKGILSTRKK